MRCQWRLLSMLGVFLILGTALSTAQDAKKDKKEPKDTKQPNYYPIEAGNEWTYKVTANGQTSKVITRIATIEKINGMMLSRLEAKGSNLTEHLSQTDKGVTRNRLNGLEIEPPFQLLPYPVKVGMKWKGEFVVKNMEGKHPYSGEIQKEETVEVPAGKYKAVRVFIEVEDMGNRVQTTYWFVRDIGFVKQTLEAGGVSVTLELEKFERKGGEKKVEPKDK